MHTQDGRWVYSLNEEIFNTGEYFNTKEEAVESGKEDLTWEGKYPTFYVGQVKSVDFALGVDTDGILEHIAQNVYDEVGEVSETYLYNVDKEHHNILEENLNNVVRQWMDQYGYNPEFYQVINIEKIS